MNASTTKTIIVFRSRTMHPQSYTLTIGVTVLKESDVLVILGVSFYCKMTKSFEKHLRSVSRAASQRLGIFSKSWQVFHHKLLFGRCLRGFVLLFLNGSLFSAADTHLKLLDRGVSGASFLTEGVLRVTVHIVNLWRYYVCCALSCVARCTLLMVLDLSRI